MKDKTPAEKKKKLDPSHPIYKKVQEAERKAGNRHKDIERMQRVRSRNQQDVQAKSQL